MAKGQNAALRLTVRGADKIIKNLLELEPRMAKKVIRQALRTGDKYIQRAAKADAPVKTGLTRRSIKVRAAKRKRDRIAILVQIGEGDYKGETFYAAFQEYGHKAGSRKLGGQRPEVPGKHFMRKAFQESAPIAEAVILGQLVSGFESVVKELGSK